MLTPYLLCNSATISFVFPSSAAFKFFLAFTTSSCKLSPGLGNDNAMSISSFTEYALKIDNKFALVFALTSATFSSFLAVISFSM